LELPAERVDLADKNLVFETLKRRRRGYFRAVPVPDSVIQLCGKVMAGVKPPSQIWPFSRATGYRLVKEYTGWAGIKGGMACPKGLRHGFAIACASLKKSR
jgi:integrase/recombinase XerD